MLQTLKMPLYAGLMGYQGEVFEGEHEAIIDRLTFERVRALLASAYGGKGPRRRNPEYLLSGIIRCARCGSALSAASSQKAKSEYRYYRCTTRDRRGRKACLTLPVSAPTIEEYVAERFREAIVESDLVREAERAAAALDSRGRELVATARKLSGEIAALSAAQAGTKTHIGRNSKGATGGSEDSRRAVAAQLHGLERQLAEVEREGILVDAAKLEAGWVSQCLRDFGAIWDVLTSTNRGRLFRAVIERVDVDDEAGEVRITLVDLGRSQGQRGSA